MNEEQYTERYIFKDKKTKKTGMFLCTKMAQAYNDFIQMKRRQQEND